MLRSLFFDINFEINHTIENYIDRIFFSLMTAIDEHQLPEDENVLLAPHLLSCSSCYVDYSQLHNEDGIDNPMKALMKIPEHNFEILKTEKFPSKLQTKTGYLQVTSKHIEGKGIILRLGCVMNILL
ncbi:hypothetical protein IEQ34_013082 [Dendrobium chrysotoxum]|uniref:Uncharacterized protein n=1 Tax=Dendrobium chrysotoxum TaxID=161865 RepID=A0AAV7GNA3_DENCH|nr:hypothetical protein IEQ34_013082 [Dendrobium chrysotoxum]